MIRALLNIIGLKEGDAVFEPFSGSGTTALEAQLLGINNEDYLENSDEKEVFKLAA